MRTEIKAAIIAGVVAIIVALITVFGPSITKTDKTTPPEAPVIGVQKNDTTKITNVNGVGNIGTVEGNVSYK